MAGPRSYRPCVARLVFCCLWLLDLFITFGKVQLEKEMKVRYNESRKQVYK